jgi:putative addiction module component (TIGR02574 family)
MRDPNQILAEALALPIDDRARLAESLLASLDENVVDAEDPDLDRSWAEEAERRSAEIDAGSVKTIPADEVFRELRAELHASRGE